MLIVGDMLIEGDMLIVVNTVCGSRIFVCNIWDGGDMLVYRMWISLMGVRIC